MDKNHDQADPHQEGAHAVEGSGSWRVQGYRRASTIPREAGDPGEAQAHGASVEL